MPDFGVVVSDKSTTAKLDHLRRLLRDMGQAVLAYSGGVDSTFLLKVAVEELGENLLAVTAVAPIYADEEGQAAVRLAAQLGARHRTLSFDPLADPAFVANPPDRCYYCKRRIFGRLAEIARADGIPHVIDGTNADDGIDFRPGMRALAELGIRSPLAEVGLGKSAIRRLSREIDLPTWDAPSLACLASRIPYGEAITAAKLKRIELAERLLHRLGFAQVRVRSHGDIARLEVEPDRIAEVAAPDVRAAIVAELQTLGFRYVALDLRGYRSGSLNEALAERPGRSVV